MQIPIKVGDKQFYIISDINQYMIGEEKIRDGKVSVEGRWFFQNLGALCAALLHLKVRSSEARTLEELRDAICRAEHEIITAFDFNRIGDSLAEKINAKKVG